MRRLLATGVYLAAMTVLALAFYELTAKSPQLLGRPLPGWQVCRRAEISTRWDPPTGILPLDQLLHEGQEALAFYGLRPLAPQFRERGP
jgi:hypothetical protein